MTLGSIALLLSSIIGGILGYNVGSLSVVAIALVGISGIAHRSVKTAWYAAAAAALAPMGIFLGLNSIATTTVVTDTDLAGFYFCAALFLFLEGVDALGHKYSPWA